MSVPAQAKRLEESSKQVAPPADVEGGRIRFPLKLGEGTWLIYFVQNLLSCRVCFEESMKRRKEKRELFLFFFPSPLLNYRGTAFGCYGRLDSSEYNRCK